MKKVMLLTFTLLVTTGILFSQVIQPQPMVQNDYLTKSKKQKKIGRLLLIGGGTLLATSLIVPRGKLVYDGICIGPWCNDEYKNDDIKSAFFIAGGVSALASIPFSIASSANRKRAKKAIAFIDFENQTALNAVAIGNHSFPVVGLKLKL